MSFGKSFDEAFRPANATASASAMDVLKEKIKTNNETAQANNIIDFITAKKIEEAMKSGIPEDEIKASIKQFEGAKKLGLKPDQLKMIFPTELKDQSAINVYNVGQSGDLTSAGQVPAGSKVFKQALTPDEIGARVKSSEEAKYGGVKEEAARAFDLRKEFQAIPQVKDFQIIKNQVSSMDALLNQVKLGDGKSALALDQGLITMFNKITDPTSVVRESEYDRTPKNLSLVNRFQGAIQKLDKGGAGLTQEDRESLVFGAKVIADSRGSAYNEVLSNYEGLSKEFGVKPELVTSGYGKFESFLKNEPESKVPSYNPKTQKLQQNSKGEYRVVNK